jgi:hypothetical protein
MQSSFKHPQIFADTLVLCQVYYPLHNSLPKPFRFAVGERILSELAECLRTIVLANMVDKSQAQGRAQGAAAVGTLRAHLEVVRAFFLMAWKLRFVSHGAITELTLRLERVSRQASRWQQWFEKQFSID